MTGHIQIGAVRVIARRRVVELRGERVPVPRHAECPLLADHTPDAGPGREPPQLRSGLDQLYDRAHGLVYLELFTGSDRGVFGDTRGTRLRSAEWYRARIRDARFVSCGLHCYVPDWLREHTAVMERCGR